MLIKKLEKVFAKFLILSTHFISPSKSTRIAFFYYKKWGIQFKNHPNYLSARIWFDSTDYSLISIGQGVTISSYVRILTHDWALHTVQKAVDPAAKNDKQSPLGRIKRVSIGDYSFIGTGTIIMPGVSIGKGCIIGAGTVVRGNIPDFSIYIGSPGSVVGDVREYYQKVISNEDKQSA